MLAALIAISGAAVADDYIEYKMQQDPAYEQNRAKAVKMLEKRSYRVYKIEADDHRGRPAFDVDAYKGNVEYDNENKSSKLKSPAPNGSPSRYS